MIITVGHSGASGDIVYSLACVRRLCETHNAKALYYIKDNNFNNTGSQYALLKDFVLEQPFIENCLPYTKNLEIGNWDSEIQFNLDAFRDKNPLGRHLLNCCFVSFFKEPVADWNSPWLSLKENTRPIQGPYVLINRTDRYHSNLDWSSIINKLDSKNKIFFVGLEREYLSFIQAFRPNTPIDHLKTNNFLELAHLINGSERVYCNQSACLTLAQGLGKDYALEIAPGHRITVCLNTSNEKILENGLDT